LHRSAEGNVTNCGLNIASRVPGKLSHLFLSVSFLYQNPTCVGFVLTNSGIMQQFGSASTIENSPCCFTATATSSVSRALAFFASLAKSDMPGVHPRSAAATPTLAKLRFMLTERSGQVELPRQRRSNEP